jgi:3-hexulose-6-phosphate synthase
MPASVAARVPFLQALGCHYLCIHLAHDLQVAQGALTVEYLRQLRQQLPDAPLAIAGGINPAILDSVLQLNPAIVVVGSAITAAKDPIAVARAMHERIASYDNRI